MASEAGGFNLGNAYGSVIIDVSGVSSAMQTVKQSLDRGFSGVGGAISSVGDKMTELGKSISTFSAPLLAAGGVGLKAAADFDSLLKQIEIFGNVAPDQLETVRQFALKMGADTKYSSSDAADALLELLKSGQSLEQAMKTLPTVLNLAATGNLDLASASGIVSSGLAIYKLKAEDAGRVSNALARAANATRADVGDLGQALANAGPVAAQFGLSIEDTSAILGIFANNGIMGGEAGTALKSVLLNLNRPTKDVKDALKLLNVNLYDGRGNTRDFNTIIKELDKSLSKLPVEQQNELMQTLGGSFGIVGLSALRAAGGLDAVKQQMESAPDAASVAASFMDTFKGNVESLTGSFETLMISALTPFMVEILQPMVKQIIDVVNSIVAWTQQNPELTKQIVSVLAVVAVLGPALAIAGTALSAIGNIIGMVLSPIGLVALAIAALVVAFQTNFLGIRDAVQPIVTWFTTVAMPAVVGFIQNTIIPAIIDFVNSLQGIHEKIDQFIQDHPQLVAGLAIIAVAIGAVTLVMGAITLATSAWAIVTGLVTGAVGLLSAAVGVLLSPAALLIAGIIGIVYAASQLYPGGLAKLFNDAASAARQLAFIGMYVLANAAEWARQKLEAVIEVVSRVSQAVNGISGIIGLLSTGQINLGDVINATAAELGQNGIAPVSAGSSTGSAAAASVAGKIGLSSRDIGGPGMAGMAYQIGSGQLKNEVYIPGADGQFVSGFVDLMKSVASGVTGSSSGGDTINVMMPEAALANPAAAHAIGQDFGRGILDEMRARGVKGMRG